MVIIKTLNFLLKIKFHLWSFKISSLLWKPLNTNSWSQKEYEEFHICLSQVPYVGWVAPVRGDIAPGVLVLLLSDRMYAPPLTGLLPPLPLSAACGLDAPVSIRSSSATLLGQTVIYCNGLGPGSEIADQLGAPSLPLPPPLLLQQIPFFPHPIHCRSRAPYRIPLLTPLV